MAVQASHVMATGSATVMLADALQYLSHWPLQPLTPTQAQDFAGLLLVGVTGLIAAWRSSRAASPPPIPPGEPK